MSDGLQAQAISAVAGLAQQAQTIELAKLQHDVEPADVYSIYNRKTGDIIKDRITAEPKPIVHRQLLDTASIVEFATRGTGGEIYYNEKGCIAIHIGADKRRYRADLIMPSSDEFNVARNIAQVTYPQRPFWNLLRTTFVDAIDESVVRIFKTLKWSDSGAVNSAVSVGKESLGKSIMADVTGEGAIPETLLLHITAFDSKEFRHKRYPLRCAVDTILESKAFRLIPMSNDLEAVRDKAMKDLREALEFHLADSKIPIIYGSVPNGN